MKIGKEDLKEELIFWCDMYGGNDKFFTKDLFLRYKDTLRKKGAVSEKMFTHISKLLKYDLKMNDEQLWKYFDPVIGLNKCNSEDLTQFMK